MPATRMMINNILNYNFGNQGYSTPGFPNDMYFGLSTSVLEDATGSSENVLSMSYSGKQVTLQLDVDFFIVGDVIVVNGVNSAYGVTNIDGTWTCIAGTTGGFVTFNVSLQPVGTTPQTITAGTVSGLPITEPSGGAGYGRTGDYNNDTGHWSTSTNGSLINTQDISFPESSAPWGTILSLFISDGSNNIIWYTNLTPSFSVIANTTVTFAANSLTVSMT